MLPNSCFYNYCEPQHPSWTFLSTANHMNSSDNTDADNDAFSGLTCGTMKWDEPSGNPPSCTMNSVVSKPLSIQIQPPTVPQRGMDGSVCIDHQPRPTVAIHPDFRPTFYNPFEVKHRRRTSRAQFKILEKAFRENPKPSARVRHQLAQQLEMTMRGVQVWFQNRRAKAKQQQQQHQLQQYQQQQQQRESPSNCNSIVDPSISLSRSSSGLSYVGSQSTMYPAGDPVPLSSCYQDILEDDAPSEYSTPITPQDTWSYAQEFLSNSNHHHHHHQQNNSSGHGLHLKEMTSVMDQLMAPKLGTPDFSYLCGGGKATDTWAMFKTPFLTEEALIGVVNPRTHGQAYNVADWIQTVQNSDDDMQHNTTMGSRRYSLPLQPPPITDGLIHDQAYWDGQPIMRRLSEPLYYPSLPEPSSMPHFQDPIYDLI